MDSEIDPFVFYLLPEIFNVNLIFYLNNNKKYSISPNKINNCLNIHIKFNFSDYKIYYSKEFINKFKLQFPFVLKDDFNNLITIKNTNNIKCEFCNEIPEILINFNRKIEPLCKNCLKKNVELSIKKRLKYFKKNNYLNEEYYCSEIPLTNATENNINLRYDDLKEILNNNFGVAEFILNEIKKENFCVICHNNFNEINKIAFCLECSCIYCEDCVKEFIKESTNNIIIYNNYESKKNKINFICKKCGEKNLNMNNFINKIFDQENLIKKANERLVKKMKKICCVCESKEIEFVFVNKNNNDNKFVHCLCNECKINLDKNKKENYENQFLCVFCDEIHLYNNIQMNKIKKNENNNNNNNNNNKNDKKNKKNNNNKENKDNKCCIIF